MNFFCRIGWHDWEFGKVDIVNIRYVEFPEQEFQGMRQEKTCKHCGRKKRVKV